MFDRARASIFIQLTFTQSDRPEIKTHLRTFQAILNLCGTSTIIMNYTLKISLLMGETSKRKISTSISSRCFFHILISFWVNYFEQVSTSLHFKKLISVSEKISLLNQNTFHKLRGSPWERRRPDL